MSAKKKNELSLQEQAIERTNIVSSQLESIIKAHAGESAIETKQDSDGKEYLSATFKLSVPTKNRSEIVVNDMALAESIERMKKQIALGEVSTIAFCKEVANFADTDASKLGFDSTADMLQALFGKGKSTLANYRRIGEYFIGDDLLYKGAIPQETSISLLNQLLSFVKRENEDGTADIRNVECLFKYGILTPYMKQKDYKKVISALGKVQTEKELKDMSEEEVKTFIDSINSIVNPKQEESKQEESKQEESKQEESKQEESKQEESKQEESKQEEEKPKTKQEIIGDSMKMIKSIEDNFTTLEVSEDVSNLVTTWLDNLYTTLADMLE